MGIREGKGREDGLEGEQREGEEGEKGKGRRGGERREGRTREGINLPHGHLKTLAALCILYIQSIKLNI